jgi:hypothetical protein
MNKLTRVVYNYANPLQPLGAAKADSDAQREKLIADLQAISDQNGKLAWVIVGALIILFLAGLWLVLFRNDLSYARVAIGLLGVSAAGSVWRLKSLWSEKSATELLLRLAVDMKGDALKQVVKVLAQRASSQIGKARDARNT